MNKVPEKEDRNRYDDTYKELKLTTDVWNTTQTL